MSPKIVVAGIGTDVGKTLVAALIARKLGYSYWKPIQCGLPKDSDFVKEFAPVIPEAYCLQTPCSPHEAAAREGVVFGDLRAPNIPLVIEPAGGLMVPIDHRLFIDLDWDAEWVLVSRYYLGSINHTLLSAHLLRSRGVRVKGIVFNGMENPYTKKAILAQSGLTELFSIPEINGPINARLPELLASVRLS